MHEQVAAEISRAIAQGDAKPGDRLPPAKDFAAVLDVNVNAHRKGRMTRVACAALAAVAFVATSGAATSGDHFPTGTFLTKITTADLYRAGLDLNDAHWEKATYRADGTWFDIWFHPRVSDQPPAHGRYVVRGDTLRVLGTPDTVRWRYDGHALTFKIVHVPDHLARLIYTAHPWQQIR